MGACNSAPKVNGAENTSKKVVIAQAPASADDYVKEVAVQWRKCLDNPDKLLDTAATKRSPFKFDREASDGHVEMDLGVCAVALPDASTEFGKRYLGVIQNIQDLWKEYMPNACKRQTTPHMSIGSIVLDKQSPQEYNNEILTRLGLIFRNKEELDQMDPPPRARIQTLKINPDGCVTFQLEHDSSQDVTMSESDLETALRKVPTCSSDDAAAAERKKFKRNEDGTFTVTRFQQIRLALGAHGSEIKGMYPSGHMVLVNLVDPKEMSEVPEAKLKELWSRCHDAFTPLKDDWFELKKVVCICYVERSLNEGSVVLAPSCGELPKAFPEGSKTAESLLGGIFTATVTGDVLIDIANFEARRGDRGRGEWQAFGGEVRELARKESGINLREKPEEELKAAFDLYDTNQSGSISSAEIGKVMTRLGEPCSEDELQAMLLRADIDGSGEISFDEFVKMMRG